MKRKKGRKQASPRTVRGIRVRGGSHQMDKAEVNNLPNHNAQRVWMTSSS